MYRACHRTGYRAQALERSMVIFCRVGSIQHVYTYCSVPEKTRENIFGAWHASSSTLAQSPSSVSLPRIEIHTVWPTRSFIRLYYFSSHASLLLFSVRVYTRDSTRNATNVCNKCLDSSISFSFIKASSLQKIKK